MIGYEDARVALISRVARVSDSFRSISQMKLQSKKLLEQDSASIAQHSEALETALQLGAAGHSVNIERAKGLHHVLKGRGGGQFRRFRMREWDVHCPPPDGVERMLRESLELAERLWWRQDVDIHIKAAAVAMAVLQVHPFEVTLL